MTPMTKNEKPNKETTNFITDDTKKKFSKNEWNDIGKVWKKNCPKCGGEQKYSTLQDYNKALKGNRQCRKCSRIGNVLSNETKQKLSTLKLGNKNPFFGKHHTQESKKLMGGSVKDYKGVNGPFYGKHHTEETKRKLKEYFHKEMKRRYSNPEEIIKMSKLVKKAMRRPEVRKRHIEGLHRSKWLKVRTDKGQLELIEKWNRLGFHFEPNYQLYSENFLCYLDGYDTIYNVVLEYDSKYHSKKNQQEKDLIRQTWIINTLKPKKFWRYDSVNKKFRNILEKG